MPTYAAPTYRRLCFAAAILALGALGCDSDALVAPEPGTGPDDPPGAEWERRGPAAEYVTHVYAPEASLSEVLVLASTDPRDPAPSLYGTYEPETEWGRYDIRGSDLIYRSVSYSLFVGAFEGGVRRWGARTEDELVESFAGIPGCVPSTGRAARVYAMASTYTAIFAASECGLFATDLDAATPFERVAFEGSDVRGVEALADTAFALVDGTVYRMGTTLDTWSRMQPFRGDATALFARGRTDRYGQDAEDVTLYARRGDVLWRMTDGQVWRRAGTLPEAVRTDTRFAAGMEQRVYATGRSGAGIGALMVSDDGGDTWAAVRKGSAFYTSVTATSWGWAAVTPERGIVCGTRDGSTTGCGSASPPVTRLVHFEGVLYALAEDRTVFRHAFGGRWERLVSQTGSDLIALGDRLVIREGGALHVSTDGITWQSTTPPAALRTFVTYEASDFALDDSGALWRSDGGATGWRRAEALPVAALALTVGLDGALYVFGADQRIYTSRDAAAWATASDAHTLALPDGIEVAMAVAADGAAFVQIGQAGFRWTGTEWRSATVSLHALTTDHRTKRLFAGRDDMYEWRGGVWVSFGDVPALFDGVVPWEGGVQVYGRQGVFVRPDG